EGEVHHADGAHGPGARGHGTLDRLPPLRLSRWASGPTGRTTGHRGATRKPAPSPFSLRRGVKASFNPSPIKLSPRTLMKMVSPGKVAVHQALRMNWSACISIWPREITLGSPTPRKLNEASVMMAPAVRSEAVGMTTGKALGRI